MKALITSCNRPDLLLETLNTLHNDQRYVLNLTIHEDSVKLDYNIDSIESAFAPSTKVKFTSGIGQHKSIEKYLIENFKDKFYLHLEDDWRFNNDYDWITSSLALMDRDKSIIKVLARKDSPHPCNHTHTNMYPDSIMPYNYGYLTPWRSTDNILWHGFSWNPGVTRADLLREFMPFPKWEQDLAELIYKKGYKVVELANPVYEHIGDGRSTH